MTTPTDNSLMTTSFDLVLPPDAELLRVVRLVASGLASLTALDLDAVEAVRVGADELVATLIQASDGTPVTVTFALTADALVIHGRTAVAPGGDFALDPLTERILDTVVTSHSWTNEDGQLHGQIDHAL